MKKSELSDIEIYESLKEGNTKALDIIYGRYWKRLFSFAYKILNDEAVCEDIVQEIFISLWNKSKETTILNLEAYLLQAVRYKTASHIRGMKFEKEHLDVLENIEVPGSVNDIEFKEAEQKIMEQVGQLPPRCREIFMLSRFEHLTNSEIAQKLNLSIQTVEKQISNALRQLRSGTPGFNVVLFVTAVFLYR